MSSYANGYGAGYLQKEALIILPAWGGGDVVHGGRKAGIETGYTNLLGLLPVPSAGVKAGPVSVGGPIPYIGIGPTEQTPGKYRRNYPRGLAEIIYDKVKKVPPPGTMEHFLYLLEKDPSAARDAYPDAFGEEEVEEEPKRDKK
jgi:hypothetical protein